MISQEGDQPMEIRVANPKMYWRAALAAVIFSGLYLTSLYRYLLFHSLVEIFSIVIGCGLFLVAWNVREFIRNNYLLFIGVAYLFVAGIDLIHMLSFKGMGIFPGSDANLPTQLWIAARYMESVSLLIAPRFVERKPNVYAVFGVYSAAFALLLVSIFYWGIFPTCFVEGVGLTRFKIVSEYAICLILMVAFVLLIPHRKEFEPRVVRLVLISIIFTIGSELAFTLYMSVFGLANLIGHYFKVISFYLMYRAIIETGLREPYGLLFRELEGEKSALQESEERLRLAQSSANVGIWERHIRSGRLIWTHEMERLYGYDPGTFPGTYEAFSERVHPDDLAEFESLRDEAVNNSKPFEFDFRINVPSGETRWITCKGAAHYDETGKPDRLFGVNLDITERKQAGDALRELKNDLEIRVKERTGELAEANRTLQKEIIERRWAEESVAKERQRLYDILETMPIMVCLLTPDRHVAFANRAFRDRFGEDNGRHCFDYCFGYEEPCESCETYRVLETGEPHHWEATGPDGSVIDAYDFPFTDTDGSPLILEMDIDITEQRRAAEDLRAASAYNRSLIEASLDPLVTVSAQGKITDANRATERATGCSRDKLIGTDFAGYFSDPEKVRLGYEQVFRDGLVKNYELAIQRDDGLLTPVLYNASLYRDASDKIAGVLAAARDISDRKQAEEELIRSNQDLQQFAYVASHDLQEPLHNVTSCLQMLQKKYKNNLDTEADQYIRYAIEASVRMKTLILDLLEYSRIATRGKTPARTDCEQVLDLTLKNLRSAIAETGSEITHDPLPTIFGDGTQLLQVFQNLLQNAIKFRKDEPPNVHVSAAKKKNEWIFSVQDNGVGIESQHLERIFVIFQRLHKRGQYDGTGMGLAIVKKVVERHGGRVWAESEPGVGSTFYFTMPEKRIRRK